MSTPSNTEDNIIKNPARLKPREENLDFFVPAYIKNGITPIQQDFSTLDGEVLDSEVETDAHIENVSVKETKATNIPNVGEFVLMVNSKVVSTGNSKAILAEAKAILYGEHTKFFDVNIRAEEIVVLKRVGLKIGVFFDE